MNTEHRTFNIERRMNVFCLFKNRFREAIPSFVIRYSIFDSAELVAGCGSLFSPAAGLKSGWANTRNPKPDCLYFNCTQASGQFYENAQALSDFLFP